MDTYYTNEKNTQILISLMKAHGIRKVVASPGTTNISLIASLQNDTYFELYSSVDERSAAYIACGLAEESGESVALSCTGATASRNYVSGLTEAYYRKLPVLAITSTQHTGRIGQNMPQVIDRTTIMNDIAKLSVQIPVVHDEEDEWAYEIMINKALLELKRHGGGPVHINLTTVYSMDFSIKHLPDVRVVNRFFHGERLPELEFDKIGIFVGSHSKWSQELTSEVDKFCELYNAVVLHDHTSNYKGKYGVNACLVCSQTQYTSPNRDMNIMIHIGDVSGSSLNMNPNQVWRVNPDGEIRDTFKKLRYVFEMEELHFFQYYNNVEKKEINITFYESWKKDSVNLFNKIPELPFSNVWVAQKTINSLPKDSVLHLGIYNSLRSWDFFDISQEIFVYSNTGGFGIDGGISTIVGASLSVPSKLIFGVIGDLSFFYDMNVIGNRHIGSNIRLLIINNGRGTEFRNYNHNAAKFGDKADFYMAAAGHFGNQSTKVIKHYAEDLGFEYISASSKKEYLENVRKFTNSKIGDKSIIFEIFTDSIDESEAIKIMNNLETTVKGTAKKMAKDVIGDKGISTIKKFIKR